MEDEVIDVQKQKMVEYLQKRTKLLQEKVAAAEQRCIEIKNELTTCPPLMTNILKKELNAEMVVLETVRQSAQEAEHDWKQLVDPTYETVSSDAGTSEPPSYDKSPDIVGSEQGHIYEQRFAALCAVVGLNFEEFDLAANMDKVGAWDDVVFKCYQNTKVLTHFVQLKHKVNSNKAIDGFQLLEQSGPFSIPKYLKDFTTIEEIFMQSENNIKLGRNNNIEFRSEDFEEAQFILYTNTRFECATPSKERNTHILSTNPEGNIKVFGKDTEPYLYKEVKRISSAGGKNLDNFFKKFLVLTEQQNWVTLKLSISAKLTEFLEKHLNMTKILVDSFLEFIEEWAVEDLGGGKCYCLNKQSVLNFLHKEAAEAADLCGHTLKP